LKRTVTFLITFILVAAIAGCASILEIERVMEEVHVANPVERPHEPELEVSNFEDLKAALLELINAHETTGTIISFSYETEDVQADLDRAIYEIMTTHPLGVYAVSDMVGVASQIVAFYEITVTIEYMRTRQQIAAITDVLYTSDLRDELLSALREYRDEAVFRTPLQITAESLALYIAEIYYQNPRKIVMRPVVAVEVFPETGDDRIFSVSFGLFQPQGLMISLGDGLSMAIARNIEEAEGGTDAEILLSLVRHLSATTGFDEAAARTLSAHGVQNPLATAFGALVNGSAVGEGFAMAFKALCDELGLDSRVILGTLGGRYHAWNLVNLGGFYYHIDVALGAENGIEAIFLRNDAGFRNMGYRWDYANTPRANGPLTYRDVAGVREPDDPYYTYPYDSDDPYAENGDEDSLGPQQPPSVTPPRQPRPPVQPPLTQEPPPEYPGEPDGAEDPDDPEEPIEPEDPDDSEYPEEPEDPEYPEDPEEPGYPEYSEEPGENGE